MFPTCHIQGAWLAKCLKPTASDVCCCHRSYHHWLLVLKNIESRSLMMVRNVPKHVAVKC